MVERALIDWSTPQVKTAQIRLGWKTAGCGYSVGGQVGGSNYLIISDPYVGDLGLDNVACPMPYRSRFDGKTMVKFDLADSSAGLLKGGIFKIKKSLFLAPRRTVREG